MSYLLRVLIALDQLLNVVVCNGWPDETMSSAVYRMEQKGRIAGRLRPLIDWIFSPWHAEHCKASYEAEWDSAHSSVSFRRPSR